MTKFQDQQAAAGNSKHIRLLYQIQRTATTLQSKGKYNYKKFIN
jgi:hypothetical protein